MKKRWIILLVVFFLLMACSKQEKEFTSHEMKNKKTVSATVVKVIDGDTIRVDINKKEEEVQLLLVDTPVESFALEASEFTKSVLPVGKTVNLEYDEEERDEEGRLLAYVYIKDKMVNEMLLEKGLARFVVHPPNTKYVDEFGALQENAQAEQLGLWSVENDAYEQEQQIVPEHLQDDFVSQDCVDPNIKGVMNAKGEKMYYVPGGKHYEETAADQLFCSEEYAEVAGYKKAQK